MLTARHGIIATVAVIAACDYVTRNTDQQISDGLRRMTARHPIAMRVGALMLAAHCVGDLPKFLDPLSGLGWIVSRVA